MRNLLLPLTMLLSWGMASAQSEIHYNNPPSIKTADYRVDAVDIVSTESYCKLKLVIQNTTKDAYFVFASDELGFHYDNIGTYWTKKDKELIVFPGEKESRVIKVDGDMDYRIPNFSLLVNGLKKGFFNSYLPESNLHIALDQTSTTQINGLTIVCNKASSKKGEISIELEVKYDGADDDMIVFHPEEFVFVAGDQPLITESKEKKALALRPGQSEKLKYTITSDAQAIDCRMNGVFAKIEFTEMEVEPVIVGTPVVTQTGGDQVSVVACDPFMGSKDGGAMKVKVYSPDGQCFRLDIDGFPVISKPTSNAIIYMDSGRRTFTIITADGRRSEGKILVPMTTTYSQVGYKVKPGKDGLDLKYAVGDQVMTEAAMAERKETMDRLAAQTATGTSGSSGNSGSSSGSSSAGSDCFGAPTTKGFEELELKVTWKGQPVTGNGIQLRYGNTPIGTGVTDGSGVARIKSEVYDEKMPNVNVYGCKGNTTWSVTGDWVVFDSSEKFHLKLDEVAAFMAEMMGMTVDEIGAGWGM